MTPGASADYVVTNSTTITFNAGAVPATGSVLTADYIVGSTLMINGSNSMISDEVPVGTVNGSNTVFTAARAYVGDSLEVWVGGVKQQRGVHFTETSPTAGTFTMSDAPITGDNILISYQFVASVSANADTVDSFHANSTPTAGTILPLDSNARVKPSAIGINYINSSFAVQGARYTTTSSTYSDISGASMTYTAGPTNERMMLTASVMAQKSSGNEGNVQLTCNGVAFGPELYYNPATSDWVRGVIHAIVPVAANQTVTIKLQGKSVGIGTFSVITETAAWIPKITGIVWPEV
jgi:hypothetical protein